MTMWADNIKFVKDIIDGKYQKIDSAAAEVTFICPLILNDEYFVPDEWECGEFTEGSKVSEKQRAFHVRLKSSRVGSDCRNWDAVGHDHRGEWSEAVDRGFHHETLQDLHGKEKELLLNESKEKIATREKALAKAKEIKAELKINWNPSSIYNLILIYTIYPNPTFTVRISILAWREETSHTNWKWIN